MSDRSIGNEGTRYSGGSGFVEEPAGTRIGGHYEVLALLGRGGMGAVYRCRDLQLGRTVALKRIVMAGASGAAGLERFRREAQAVASLNHRNIVTVHQFAEDANGPYLVMELLDGVDLGGLVARRGALPLAEVLDTARQVGAALSYAHRRGVVHRDIKPTNLFRLKDGTLKVLDFGLARMGTDSQLSQEGFGLGTLDYASPEQRRDATSADHRSDLFGLGATLYYLATGKAPRLVRERDLPEELRGVVLSMLEDRSEDRPFSVEEALAPLKLEERASTGREPAARRKSSGEGACAACGAPNSSGARFCQECGAGFFKACPSCGDEGAPGRKFCAKCGSAMTSVSAPALVSPPAEPISAPPHVEPVAAAAEQPPAAVEAPVLPVETAPIPTIDEGARAAQLPPEIEPAVTVPDDRSADNDGAQTDAVRDPELASTPGSAYVLRPNWAAIVVAIVGVLFVGIVIGDSYGWWSREETISAPPSGREPIRPSTPSQPSGTAPRELRLERTLTGHEEEVTRAAFSRDGSRIVTASYDETARIWDARTGTLLATLSGHEAGVASAVFSPDGSRVVTASEEGETAQIWDARTGARLTTLSGHEHVVTSAAFSPDGSRIVTASADETAGIWDARTGTLLATLSGHEDEVASAAFSPDGSRIVTASWDDTARIWDARTRARLMTLSGHEDGLTSAAFSPDGTRIVTTSEDETARIWDARTGALLVTVSGDLGNEIKAAFSPDGTRIVTASHDEAAHIWDARTGARLGEIAHPARVNDAAFSPDGSRIVTASDDKLARVWRIPSTPPPGAVPPRAAAAPKLSPLPGKEGTVPSITEVATVRLRTTGGDIVIEVYSQAAPNAARRFLELAGSGFYDDTPISRVVPGFVAQFGINWRAPHKAWQQRPFNDDPTLFALERGTVAFAKAGPNTNSTQVFINYATNNQLAEPRYNFTVFGKVVSGMEVVDKFAQVGDPSNGLDQARLWADGGAYLQSLPVKPTMIQKTTVIP